MICLTHSTALTVQCVVYAKEVSLPAYWNWRCHTRQTTTWRAVNKNSPAFFPRRQQSVGGILDSRVILMLGP